MELSEAIDYLGYVFKTVELKQVQVELGRPPTFSARGNNGPWYENETAAGALILLAQKTIDGD